MTRTYKHKSVCSKCGSEVDTVTPFSQWLRALKYPLNSANVDCQNLDYIWFWYRTGWFITIEEKRYGATSQQAQNDTHNIIRQMLTLASGSEVQTMRGKRKIHYRGHFIISFEQTTPDNSKWVSINNTRYDKARGAVTRLLKDGRL